jgi:hypothetical protein
LVEGDPFLQEMGYHVVAVQNPITSLADEVAFTKRIVARQDGPVILVGHSWSVELAIPSETISFTYAK